MRLCSPTPIVAVLLILSSTAHADLWDWPNVLEGEKKLHWSSFSHSAAPYIVTSIFWNYCYFFSHNAARGTASAGSIVPVPLSDVGAWHGYSLPDGVDPTLVGGFTGPWLHGVNGGNYFSILTTKQSGMLITYKAGLESLSTSWPLKITILEMLSFSMRIPSRPITTPACLLLSTNWSTPPAALESQCWLLSSSFQLAHRCATLHYAPTSASPCACSSEETFRSLLAAV